MVIDHQHGLIGEADHALGRRAGEELLEAALARSSDDREISLLASQRFQDSREGIADHNVDAHAGLSGLGQRSLPILQLRERLGTSPLGDAGCQAVLNHVEDRDLTV